MHNPLASLCSSSLLLHPQLAQNGGERVSGAPTCAPQGSLRPLEGMPVRARALLGFLCAECGVSQDEALLHADYLELLLLCYTAPSAREGGASSAKRARKG